MPSNYESYEWFLEQDLSEYSGKWIAIVDKKVVAVGSTPKEVLNNTKLKTTKKPLITRISNKLRILRL